ncbi:hypothetical protein EBR56_00100 [bacterium]|nr:hypothetical protein [bacterium]
MSGPLAKPLATGLLALAVVAIGHDRSGTCCLAESPAEHPAVADDGRPTAAHPRDVGPVENRSAARDAAFPIRQAPVSRATYFKWLQFSRHLRYVENPTAHGQYGPRHFMPVLARYVQTGDRAYGLACVRMLGAFHRWVRVEVADKGWHPLFGEEAGYLGLYRHYLTRGGLIAADEPWFRDLYLEFARGLHPWDSRDTFWRGPMHRAQGEGVVRGLAARWYPDIPEAREWLAYSDRVYQDWWRFRDFAANDTNYLFATLLPLFLRATLLDDGDFFNDPAMPEVWNRLLEEVSPDGSVPPYGANQGWNDTAGVRIALLEMLAARTGDGRYRYVAHRMMNYLIYQRLRYREHHMLLGPQTTEPLALACLVADDSIEPVMPDPGSKILHRRETVRLPGYGTGPRDKALAQPVIGVVDERDDRGFIDCGLLVTDARKPSKLVLRSGWEPGDFYVLVELFPRHDPLNPLGILGMTSRGAALTCSISAKGVSDENRVVVSARAGKAAPATRDITAETEIIDFIDADIATYASASVTGYEGLPVTCSRHFMFVKNEFLLVRDSLTAHEPLEATVASVFNAQDIDAGAVPPAALVSMSHPAALDVGLLNPAVDLLVYHCPQKDLRLLAVDRTATDPRANSVRGQLRYEWGGHLGAGESRRFATLLRPQRPPAANAPVGGNPAARSGTPLPGVDADSIEVHHDDDRATVLRLRSDGDREQWVVANPLGQPITTAALRTDARAAYIETRRDAVVRAWSHEASTLVFRGAELADSAAVSTVDGP